MSFLNPTNWFGTEKSEPIEEKEPEYICTEAIYAPVNGDILALERINDAIYSEKMMGEGFGIKPSDGNIYAPVSGTIQSVFGTEHAISILTEHGAEFLIHLGLDTVELQGGPFEALVTEGQVIMHGDNIATMDLDDIMRRQFDPTVVVVVTNSDANSKLRLVTDRIEAQEKVGEIDLYQ